MIRLDNVGPINPDVTGAKPLRPAARDGDSRKTCYAVGHLGILPPGKRLVIMHSKLLPVGRLAGPEKRLWKTTLTAQLE